MPEDLDLDAVVAEFPSLEGWEDLLAGDTQEELRESARLVAERVKQTLERASGTPEAQKAEAIANRDFRGFLKHARRQAGIPERGEHRG